MTSTPYYTLKINQLNCYMQEEGDGDEVFLKYKKKRLWPENIKYKKVNEGSHKIQLEITEVEKDQKIELELWDYDFLSPNDKLGVFKMLINERGGPFTTDLKGKSGAIKYSIEWEVH